MQVIDVYYERCPNCPCREVRVRELVADDGAHFEEEECPDCGYFFVIELHDREEERACQS